MIVFNKKYYNMGEVWVNAERNGRNGGPLHLSFYFGVNTQYYPDRMYIEFLWVYGYASSNIYELTSVIAEDLDLLVMELLDIYQNTDICTYDAPEDESVRVGISKIKKYVKMIEMKYMDNHLTFDLLADSPNRLKATTLLCLPWRLAEALEEINTKTNH